MPRSVHTEVLKKAADILGGKAALRHFLRVPMHKLDLWMVGVELLPSTLFLEVVDVITAQRTGAEHEALRRSMALWRKSGLLGQAAVAARRTASDARENARALVQHSKELRAGLLDAAAVLMRSDAASMQILDVDKDELLLIGWKGFHPDSAAHWQRVSLGNESTCGAALRARRRVIVPDVSDPAFGLTEEGIALYRLSGLVAVQSTPLAARDGRLLGMLSTHWRRVHQPAASDLALFDVLAREAANVLERVPA